MNKWSMDGNYIENWTGGGGNTFCSPAGKRHYSIHPRGRTDEYRHANRRDRFKPRMHGQSAELPQTSGKKGRK